MDKKQIASIIQVLQAVRERPLMFVGTDLSGVSHFLNGFNAACGALGLNKTYEAHYAEALSARGWRLRASLIQEMEERGLDNETIANELLSIQIETWQRLSDDIRDNVFEKTKTE